MHFIRDLGNKPNVVAAHIPLGEHLGKNRILRINVANTHIKIISHDLPLENSIFWDGLGKGWEKVSLGLWMQLCKNANIVFDVGANIGIYSLAAKVANPLLEVYAFEPLGLNFEILKNNCKINQFDIHCNQMAVSNTNGEGYITYQSFNTADRAHLTDNKPSSLTGINEKVNIVRLDTFIADHGIKNVCAIKIDAERHEKEVLEGMGGCIKNMRPAIIIEVLSDDIGGQIEKMVKGHGYLYYNIDENGKIRKMSSITKSDYFNYLLCSDKQARLLNLV